MDPKVGSLIRHAAMLFHSSLNTGATDANGDMEIVAHPVRTMPAMLVKDGKVSLRSFNGPNQDGSTRDASLFGTDLSLGGLEVVRASFTKDVLEKILELKFFGGLDRMYKEDGSEVELLDIAMQNQLFGVAMTNFMENPDANRDFFFYMLMGYTASPRRYMDLLAKTLSELDGYEVCQLYILQEIADGDMDLWAKVPTSYEEKVYESIRDSELYTFKFIDYMEDTFSERDPRKTQKYLSGFPMKMRYNPKVLSSVYSMAKHNDSREFKEFALGFLKEAQSNESAEWLNQGLESDGSKTISELIADLEQEL